MLKPPAFQQPCLATRNLPYINLEEVAEMSLANGGVLGTGQTVWIEASSKPAVASCTAFVEGIGLVKVDARWLAKTEAVARQPEVLDEVSMAAQTLPGMLLRAPQLSRQ